MKLHKTFNLILLITFSTIFLSCEKDNATKNESKVIETTKEKSVTSLNKNYPHSIKEDNLPFTFQVSINEINNNNYSLDLIVEPEKGSYIISPFSENEVVIPLKIVISDSNFIEFPKFSLKEIPAAEEEFDEIFDMLCKRVRVKTNYKQPFEIISKMDFEGNGYIELMVEPECVPFNIPFTITSLSGNLSVNTSQITTVISEENLLNRRAKKDQTLSNAISN